jgi:hypothetical protein
MSEMVLLIQHFMCGAAIGCAFALSGATFKNSMAFKKEDKPTTDKVFKWVLIGFLFGGALGTIFIKG